MSGRERVWRLLAPARGAAEFLPRRSAPPRIDGGAWQAAVRELTASLRGTLDTDARRIAAGELSFWGHIVLVDPRAPDWRREPLIPQASSRAHDRKPLWELHRQQHLFPLIAGAQVEGCDESTSLAFAQVENWIAANPRRRGGPGWASAHETAHRLVQWAWALPLAASSIEPRILERIERSYAQQTRFVAARPSRHSSANNHRLGEIVGLLHAAALAQDARMWDRLWSELEAQAEAQAYADGGSREQGVGYFLYVLEMLWVAGLLARSLERSLGRVGEQLARRVSWAIETGDATLDPPPFGDDGEDRIIRLSYFQPRSAHDIVALAAALLDDELVLETPKRVGASDESHVLPSGLAIFRGTEPCTRISVDIGELGFGALAAHGHADALSVVVDGPEGPLLRDSGTGSYAQAEHRELLRSTAAHNTVEVGGVSQAEPLGPHLWGRRYTVTVEEFTLTDEYDYVRAGHDGYLRDFGAMHRRGVLFLKPDLLLIMDRVEAEHPQDVSLHWHLVPGATPEDLGDGASLQVLSEPESERVSRTWPYSPRYKNWLQAERWSWQATARELRFVTLVGLRAAEYKFEFRQRGAVDEILVEGRVSFLVYERWVGAPEIQRRG